MRKPGAVTLLAILSTISLIGIGGLAAVAYQLKAEVERAHKRVDYMQQLDGIDKIDVRLAHVEYVTKRLTEEQHQLNGSLASVSKSADAAARDAKDRAEEASEAAAEAQDRAHQPCLIYGIC